MKNNQHRTSDQTTDLSAARDVHGEAHPQVQVERQRLINETLASDLTGMSVAWFQRKRWSGDGPPYRKIGSAVRYQLGELLDWFAGCRRVNSSESME
ncbi:MAG: helix-turn-helix domain-containing protein [Candidatus Obscuribacterales bacterium]|nr:helix-turn-helix domain-containing protein [Candidatus Obscuribacterales bacterium]